MLRERHIEKDNYMIRETESKLFIYKSRNLSNDQKPENAKNPIWLFNILGLFTNFRLKIQNQLTPFSNTLWCLELNLGFTHVRHIFYYWATLQHSTSTLKCSQPTVLPYTIQIYPLHTHTHENSKYTNILNGMESLKNMAINY